MKRILLSLAILIVGSSLMFAQNYVSEWEGPVGFRAQIDDDYFITLDNYDMDSDGIAELVFANYDDINTTINVYNSANDYALIWSHQFEGEISFISFGNITDEASKEMIVSRFYNATEEEEVYIINTLTYEFFLLSSEDSRVLVYDVDGDSKDEIILDHFEDAVLEIWGDGTQSSINNHSVPQSILKLNQNYPNPFNPTTTINYDLKNSGFINLKVYNVKGQLVDTLINQEVNAGKHSAIWNTKGISSGQYFYQISIDGKAVQTKKAICLK